MHLQYDPYHTNPANLVIHIVAIPFFVLGVLAALWSLLVGSWVAALGYAVLPILSLAVQGLGHKLERLPPEPFTSPANFFARVFSEQFFKFWVFVLSGRWLRAVRA